MKGVPAVRHAVNVIGVPDTCYVKSIQYGGRDVTDGWYRDDERRARWRS